VLRGSPRPVVRFRRGLIIGITGLVAACLVTVTWFALGAAELPARGGRGRGRSRSRKAAPEALANAPEQLWRRAPLGPPLCRAISAGRS
jgi:hypothetical protein